MIRELDCKFSGIAALAAVALLLVLGTCAPAVAGTLPDDRADVLFHSYDGGGGTIQGPSLLMRKQFAIT